MLTSEFGAILPPPSSMPDWGQDLKVGFCPECKWRFMVKADQPPLTCPHCFKASMENLEPADYLPLADLMRPPELFLPFSLTQGQVDQVLSHGISGIPFAPDDLKVDNLQKRLKLVWLPMWLVDASARAEWQAEVGFNYQVKSHNERYSEGAGWQTQEVLETRQNWEPRLGSLERTYHNVTAPAVDAYLPWTGKLGQFQLEKAQRYDASTIIGVMDHVVICLPDRSPIDAWSDALPTFKSLASAECRQACEADHIRDYLWKPEFHNQNWSLLLLPVLTTFYQDDENQPQQVLIHGQTGKQHSMRKASLRKAQAVSLTIVMAALLLFGLSLCLGAFSALSPVMLPLAGIGIVIALLVALSAIYPISKVWLINRKQ